MDYRKLVNELFDKESRDRSFHVIGGKKEPVVDISNEAIWEEIDSRIKARGLDQESDSVPNYLLRIAASSIIALLITGLVLYNYSYDTQIARANTGSVNTMNFGENSKVTINAETEIQLSSSRSLIRPDYKVSFSGEALFEVSRDLLLVNLSNEVSISCSEGSFNVLNRNGNVIISSLDAFIEIISKSTNFNIGPGKSISINVVTGVLSKVMNANLDHFGSWTRGEFYFNNLAMVDILDEFQRQFGAFDFKNYDPLKKITVSFHRRQGWEKGLSLIAEAGNMTFDSDYESRVVQFIRKL